MCGPVRLTAVPIAGADAHLFGNLDISTEVMVEDEPSETSVLTVQIIGAGDTAASNATAVNITAIADPSAQLLEAVLPPGASSVALVPTTSTATCSISVPGSRISPPPAPAIAVPMQHPLTLPMTLVAGDNSHSYEANLTLVRQCGPGYRLEGSGPGFCIPCPRNSYTSEIDSTVCTEVEAGISYTVGPGSGPGDIRPCTFDLSLGGPYTAPGLTRTSLGSELIDVSEDKEVVLRKLLRLSSIESNVNWDGVTDPYALGISVALRYRARFAASLGTITVLENSIGDPANDIELLTVSKGHF
jgi:hypothetical protein